MSNTVSQDVIDVRCGIDETSRRFEDAFNRGDASIMSIRPIKH